MSIKVVIDSGGDIPSDLLSTYEIEIVPLKIRFGTEEFIDTKDLTTEQFWEKCHTSKDLPQTSAPSAGDFEKAFLKARADGHQSVVCITLSSNLSATYQSAKIAAETVRDQISVELIDSRLATFAMGSLAIAAAVAAKNGSSPTEIASMLRARIPLIHAFGALDTLENLRKGGRIGTAAAFFGSLLSFKPIIDIRDGVIEADSKQRTRGKALEYLVNKVLKYGEIADLAIIHANAPDILDFTAKLKKATGINEITISQIGPVIGTHAGPRTMGVTFRTIG